MKKPMCMICNHAHNSWEPHVLSGTDTVAISSTFKAEADLVRPKKKAVAVERNDVFHPVTVSPSPVTESRGKHCPTCTCGTRALYASKAEKQRAYRARKKE